MGLLRLEFFAPLLALFRLPRFSDFPSGKLFLHCDPLNRGPNLREVHTLSSRSSLLEFKLPSASALLLIALHSLIHRLPHRTNVA
jgi:hypothetical protein